MVSIKKATAENLACIVDILNAATQKLLAKGVMQWEYPWAENVIADDISKGLFYIANVDEKAVGCFGLKKFENNPFNGDNSGMYFYHLAVHPKYSGKNYSVEMCKYVQNFAKENNTTVYFDCWAGNDFLKKFYADAGFEYMGDFPEEDYFVSAFKTK